MHVNDVEINGFLIDEFNQHGLEVGKTQGICPLCSHDRKPEHKKLKCASYDWERGLGTCHNCNQTFQLHTYHRNGSTEKEYVIPDLTTVFFSYIFFGNATANGNIRYTDASVAYMAFTKSSKSNSPESDFSKTNKSLF